ncbi:MAG: aminotransferase class IV family protein [Phycisphaeraceae bacterium]|nr:aminotransferase class IV family protein [Phycisphaeraceae bacterium]
MALEAFSNGEFVDPDRAVISGRDAGLLHGVGLFETMAAIHGRIIALDRHLERLLTSARTLGLPIPFEQSELALAVEQTLKRNGLVEARIRLTMTPGSLSLLAAARGQAPASPPRPTVHIEVTPPVVYAPSYFEDGILATVAPRAINPFEPTAGHKTLNYWSRLILLGRAAAAGAGEVICLSTTNHLVEGAVSNLFLVRNGVLYTPPARDEVTDPSSPSGVLPGITRSLILDLAAECGIEVVRCELEISDLLDADEVFLTNSSWHILPVRQVERKAIGNARPGPVTMRLRSEYTKRHLDA